MLKPAVIKLTRENCEHQNSKAIAGLIAFQISSCSLFNEVYNSLIRCTSLI